MKKIFLTLVISILCISTFATPNIIKFDLSDLSANREFVRLSNNPQNFTAVFTVTRSLVPGTSQWENIACAVTLILLDKTYKEKKELSVPYTFITDGTESNYKDKTISGKINQSDIQPGDRIGIKLTYDNGTKPVSTVYGTGYKIQEPSVGGEPGVIVGGPNGTIGIYSWMWKEGGSNALQPYKDANLEYWKLNRLEFYAYADHRPGTVPIYIFKGNYGDAKSSFIYEFDPQQDSFWEYQLVKFYAYNTHVPGTVPIYRYTSIAQGRNHYYSAQGDLQDLSRSERDRDKWIAFYAFPPFNELLNLPPSASETDANGNRVKPLKPRTDSPPPVPPRPGGGRGGRN